MNNVQNLFDEIINADLSLDEYAKLTELLSEQIKEMLYAKFLLDTSLSRVAIRDV